MELNVTSFKETIRIKGKPTEVEAFRVNEQTFLITGKFLKTAEIKDFWAEDVKEPPLLVRGLKKSAVKLDILKFWQRIPESEPKYPYYHEWQNVAAIPITTHKHWFEKQINQKARNKIRKAAKNGVKMQEEQLNDRLIQGVTELYNDSPVRRGKRFWHYGKNFETVKTELTDNVEICRFVTAYCEGELIGFIKFFIFDRYARTTLVLDKLSRREKSPMNGLISKCIEICADRGIPHFVYSVWRRGDHGRFQASNGFVKTPVPEYYVPLTVKGRAALALNLHRGIKGAIPDKMMIRLLNVRAKWYSLRFGTDEFRVSRSATSAT